MKTNKISAFTLLAIGTMLMLFSCAPNTFIANNFEREFPKNGTVAILPYQVTFNGKMPKNMSEEQRLKQDREERTAFQQSLFSYLAGKLQGKPVKIMPIQQSNAKLSDMGFDIYKIEQYQAQQLAKALGVDAVITPALEKYRYKSDEESLALDAISSVLFAAKAPIGLPRGVSNTNDVKANCAMVSAKDGTLLWNVGRTGAANWNYPVNNVMDDLHRRMARKLPNF